MLPKQKTVLFWVQYVQAQKYVRVLDLVNNWQYLAVQSTEAFHNAVLITHRKHIHTPNEFISLLHIAFLKKCTISITHTTFFFLVL